MICFSLYCDWRCTCHTNKKIKRECALHKNSQKNYDEFLKGLRRRVSRSKEHCLECEPRKNKKIKNLKHTNQFSSTSTQQRFTRHRLSCDVRCIFGFGKGGWKIQRRFLFISSSSWPRNLIICSLSPSFPSLCMFLFLIIIKTTITLLLSYMCSHINIS